MEKLRIKFLNGLGFLKNHINLYMKIDPSPHYTVMHYVEHVTSLSPLQGLFVFQCCAGYVVGSLYGK